MCFTVELSRQLNNDISGADAVGGHTRSHPEHDGEDPIGRWYCTGDGVGEQVGARSKRKQQAGNLMKIKQALESESCRKQDGARYES